MLIANYRQSRLFHELKQLIGDDGVLRKTSEADEDGDAGAAPIAATVDKAPKDPADSVPLRVDIDSFPAVEWWDEAFLPKDIREARKRASKPILPLTSASASSVTTASSSSSSSGAGAGSSAGSIEDFYTKVAIANAKTHM